MNALSSRLRSARVGDLVSRDDPGNRRTRRLDATAFVVPGTADLGAYVAELNRHGDDFAAWDGQTALLSADGNPEHLVAIVDRYGQLYEATTAADASALPDPHALEEWFRFLATACPECGVIDDPRPRDWVP